MLIFSAKYVKIMPYTEVLMEEYLIARLSVMTEEVRRLLDGGELERSIYTAEDDFVINEARLRGGKGSISVRTHTRYADFPRHRHNYLEMMILLEGSITHVFDASCCFSF